MLLYFVLFIVDFVFNYIIIITLLSLFRTPTTQHTTNDDGMLPIRDVAETTYLSYIITTSVPRRPVCCCCDEEHREEEKNEE